MNLVFQSSQDVSCFTIVMCKQVLVVEADHSLDQRVASPFTGAGASKVASIRYLLCFSRVLKLKGESGRSRVDDLVEDGFGCILWDLVGTAGFKYIRKARDDGYYAGHMLL